MRDSINVKAIRADEWQTVVDAAEGALCMESARQYGLVTGGPTVHVNRCEYLLAEGKKRGYSPAHDAVEKFVKSLESRHAEEKTENLADG